MILSAALPTSMAYRITRRSLGLVCLLCALGVASGSRVEAQVVAPTVIGFDSPDHNAVVPAGQVSAGQPKVTSYQFLLLLSSADAATGAVVQAGSVIPKASVAANTTTFPGATTQPAFQVTVAQAGLTIPPCTTLPCPSYSFVGITNGVGGSSLRGVGSESPSFTAVVPVPTALPAAPANVQVR